MVHNKISVVLAAMMVLWQGSRITPFEDPWSNMTMIELNPCEGGRLVMKSIIRREKGRSPSALTGNRAGLLGWRLILCCWQAAQPST